MWYFIKGFCFHCCDSICHASFYWIYSKNEYQIIRKVTWKADGRRLRIKRDIRELICSVFICSKTNIRRSYNVLKIWEQEDRPATIRKPVFEVQIFTWIWRCSYNSVDNIDSQNSRVFFCNDSVIYLQVCYLPLFSQRFYICNVI